MMLAVCVCARCLAALQYNEEPPHAVPSRKAFIDHTAPARLRGGQPVMTTKGWDMIRELFAAAAVAGAAVGTAPAALADDGDNMYFDKPGHYSTDVPGMND